MKAIGDGREFRPAYVPDRAKSIMMSIMRRRAQPFLYGRNSLQSQL